MNRILLATMPVGGGHTALRDSLWTALTAFAPASAPLELLSFDSQDTKVSDFYDFCIHKAPSLQGLLFKLGDTWPALSLCVRLNPQLEAEARRALLHFRPHLVVSTHFLLSAMFVRARRQLRWHLPIVSAIPDYGEPTQILAPRRESLRMDALIVMDPQVRERLRRRGDYPPSRVHLSGFIPHEPFLRMGQQIGPEPRLPEARRQALWHALRAEAPLLEGLEPSRPTLLFLGGSAWTERTLPVLERLLHTPGLLEHLNVVVVCGRDERFRETLRARVRGRPRWALFGFVGPELMAQLMVLADVPVLGSLAPASMHELMETRCGPLMLFHFLPGSENAHPAYIQQQGLGVYEPDADTLLHLLAQATRLERPGPRMAPLLEGYATRMRDLRTANLSRAMRLGTFLSRLMALEGPEAAGFTSPASEPSLSEGLS